jgi:Uma2 family endonuclease
MSPLTPITPTTPPSGGDGAPAEPASCADRFLIRNIDWKAYRQISDVLGEHHGYRLSYDGRDLELMTKSKRHGRYGHFLSAIVQIVTAAMGLELDSCGDMTCDRKDLEKGIEPDDCFYIQNEPLMRDKEEVDLSVDPPPDLGIEIDITTDARRRMGIYAAIRVPEIWRYQGRDQTVIICILQPDGQYAIAERSHCLPIVTAAVLTSFVQRRRHEPENELLRAFGDWVRAELQKQQ